MPAWTNRTVHSSSQNTMAMFSVLYLCLWSCYFLLLSLRMPLIHSFLLSCSFWSWHLCNICLMLKKTIELRFATELLRHSMCMKSIYTQKTLILCMDFRIHYTLQVLRVTVAFEWLFCVWMEYNTVKNHPKTCSGQYSDNQS